MSDVEEFWVLNWKGNTLFCYPSLQNFDSDLFGKLFSAIRLFIDKLDDPNKYKYNHSICIGGHRYYLRTNHYYQLLFILKAHKSKKEKQIVKHFMSIEMYFIDKYAKNLGRFEENPSTFEGFYVILKEYLNEIN